ncbi:eight-cysteine-cluster domain-containing protein [Candidatus Pacearchaeota archaeon]|nr:eight-cysteine-cluster domain-containing protein [Candidatus Pacearchaeota archaeon]
MKNKKFYQILIVILLLSLIILVALLNKQPQEITNFNDCANAGYPILESYPRQCKTPDGRFFTEIIPPTELSEDFCGLSTYGSCSSDFDCIKGGCSGQVCQSKNEEPIITTCEFRECYNAEKYDMQCKCVNEKCQWNPKE